MAEMSEWQPVIQRDRYPALDAIRGMALGGVLIVNLLSDFRVSLAEHILTFPTDPVGANRTVEVLIAAVLEFKAFALFSFLFGVGVAVFAERAGNRQLAARRFLLRRFTALLAIGLCHLLIIWNGDILTLYAVCGFLLLPILNWPITRVASLGVTFILLSSVAPWGWLWPSNETLHRLAEKATFVYSQGRFGDVLVFHWQETHQLILPLLVTALPKTLGLMALGVATWRAGVFREPGKHLRLLWTTVLCGGIIGGAATTLEVYSSVTGQPTVLPLVLIQAGSSVPLAFCYIAALILAMRNVRFARFATLFTAAGQMALTNYLAQSVMLSVIFYSYGFGLYGHVGSAAAGLIGVTLYLGQLRFSRAWLTNFQFGPVEWCWRSLTYGHRQPMRRISKQVK